MFTAVRPTQSAFNQDATRRSEEDLKPDYKALRDSMKAQAVGHTDATGWRVDGETAQLIAYASGDATVYDIQERYRNEEVREVFPGDFKGTLVGDGAKVFDAKALGGVKQQKCIFHALKLIREACEKQEVKEREFGELLRGMLHEGLALWHGYHEGKKKGYRAKVAKLDERLTKHLRERTLSNDDNQRILKFFREHHRKGALTRFLHDPRVPPTNNLSELELRFLITARKVSQCPKNRRGAHARRVLGSPIRTEKREVEKEQRQSETPYTDQKTSQAERRSGNERRADMPSAPRSKPSLQAVDQAEAQVEERGGASPSHPTGLLDRVTGLLRRARHRWEQAEAAIDRVFGLPRPRSP